MRKPSLVLITVDCLRADHVGFLGYSRPVTPTLDALAQQSVVFADAIVAGAPTYYSLPAILAARYPLSLGRDVLGIAPGETTLATALRDAGYATAGFLAGNPYLNARFGYDQGFDTFREFLNAAHAGGSFQSGGHDNRWSILNRRIHAVSRKTRVMSAAYDRVYFWYGQLRSAREHPSMHELRRYPAADVIVDQARAWLSSLGDDPFFLWIHLMDPHHPYYPPEEALSAIGASPMTARRARFLNSFWNRWDLGPQKFQRYRDEVLTLYDAGVYWADKQISRLIETLRHFQRWDETVFVVTADHGEEFLERGARYHSPNNLREQLIHVPLLVRAPELPGARLSEPFSLVHLAPTLLEALEIAIPDGFEGSSHWQQALSRKLPAEPAIVECADACNNPFRVHDRIRPRLMAVQDHEYKLVLRFGEKDGQLYDLKNDPEERSPLPTDSFLSERARLLQAALAHVRNGREKRDPDLALRARIRDIRHSILERPKP